MTGFDNKSSNPITNNVGIKKKPGRRFPQSRRPSDCQLADHRDYNDQKLVQTCTNLYKLESEWKKQIIRCKVFEATIADKIAAE